MLLSLCDLQDAVVVLQKGRFRFYSYSYPNKPSTFCLCQISQLPHITVQSNSLWSIYLTSHTKKKTKQGISCTSDTSKYIPWVSGSVQYFQCLEGCCVLSAAQGLVFFLPPNSFWRGVLVGRWEPNSVPLLLLFQGGRRCEPLKQQEETAGGRSDWHAHRQAEANRHVVPMVPCYSVHKTRQLLKYYENIEIYSTHLTVFATVPNECIENVRTYVYRMQTAG